MDHVPIKPIIGILTGAVLLQEAAYYSYSWWLKRQNRKLRAKMINELCDVIWINELTNQCQCNVLYLPKKCSNTFCASQHIRKVIKLIRETKYSIDLCMFIFTLRHIGSVIEEAFERGVKVRVICDEPMRHVSSSQIKFLEKAGIPIRVPKFQSKNMHHKFCILDGPQRVQELRKASNLKKEMNATPIVLTGSLNWTTNGFTSNWENMVISSNSTLVGKFDDEFERMWSKFKPIV